MMSAGHYFFLHLLIKETKIAISSFVSSALDRARSDSRKWAPGDVPAFTSCRATTSPCRFDGRDELTRM